MDRCYCFRAEPPDLKLAHAEGLIAVGWGRFVVVEFSGRLCCYRLRCDWQRQIVNGQGVSRLSRLLANGLVDNGGCVELLIEKVASVRQEL